MGGVDFQKVNLEETDNVFDEGLNLLMRETVCPHSLLCPTLVPLLQLHVSFCFRFAPILQLWKLSIFKVKEYTDLKNLK